MSLTGAQFKQLQDALCNAFDSNFLEQMVRFHLGEKLEDIVKLADMRRMTFDLISEFEQRGTTDELIRATYTTRSKNPQVLEYCRQHAPFVFQPVKSAEEVTESVGVGLTALANIMERLEAGGVRHIIQTFQDHFLITRTRIVWLEKYKALHDCLHNLDFKYYRELGSAVANFCKDAAAAEQLDDYTSDLAHEVQKARKYAEALPSHQIETRWIDQFDRVVTALRQALDGADDVPAQRALQLLGRLLTTEPSRINGHLTSTAADLRLRELIRAMRQVRDIMGWAAPQNSHLPLQEFQAGLKDLEGLQPRLMSHVEQHLQWQWIDNDLRLADATSGQSLDDVLDVWPVVSRGAQSLYDLSRETDWAEELQRLADRVNVASTAQNPAELLRSFKRFRRAAMRRFYNVDIGLRELCDKLVLIGGPLDAVLRVLAHADK